MSVQDKEEQAQIDELLASGYEPAAYYGREGIPLRELLTVEELSTLLLVDSTTVRRWIAKKILDVVALPHRGRRQAYRIRLSTVVVLLHLQEGETIDLLSVHTLARELRVDETTVRRWIKSGTLEAVSLPRAGKREVYRVKRQTKEKLLQPTIVVKAQVETPATTSSTS